MYQEVKFRTTEHLLLKYFGKGACSMKTKKIKVNVANAEKLLMGDSKGTIYLTNEGRKLLINVVGKKG